MIINEILQLENQTVWWILAGLCMLIGIYKTSRFLRIGLFFTTLILVVATFLLPLPGCDFFTTTFCIGIYVVVKKLIAWVEYCKFQFNRRKQEQGADVFQDQVTF